MTREDGTKVGGREAGSNVVVLEYGSIKRLIQKGNEHQVTVADEMTVFHIYICIVPSSITLGQSKDIAVDVQNEKLNFNGCNMFF